MEEMHPARQTHLLKRGAYDAPGDVVDAEHTGEPAAVPGRISRAIGWASRAG